MTDINTGYILAPGGLGGGIFLLWRMYRGIRQETRADIRADAIGETQKNLFSHLESEIKRLTEQGNVLTKRLDDMAAKRNDVMVENAKLVTKVDALEQDVKELKTEIAKVEKERDSALGTLRRMEQVFGTISSDENNKGRRSVDKLKNTLNNIDDRDKREM